MPKKKIDPFHTSAGTGKEGMYHPNARIVDGMALEPRPGIAREAIQKKKAKEFVKKADKKLKGFKYGVGVGP